MRGDDNRWRLTGIVSWGFGGKGKLNLLKIKFKKFFIFLQKKGSIGFYTRINGFTDWIIQNILLN